MSEALPSRPDPGGHVAGCDYCDNRAVMGTIACSDHRTADEWSWMRVVDDLAELRSPPPTLF